MTIYENDESNGEQYEIMQVAPKPASLTITIHRVELVIITNTDDPIETRTFTAWADAFAWLKERGLPLTSEHEEAIKQHPTTTTNAFMEMVSRGNSAYSARVYYVIEVTGVQS